MTIVEAVIEALKESDNEGIGWGDSGLLNLVRQKLEHDHKITKPRWIYCEGKNWEQKILNALDRSPLFEKKFSHQRWGRPHRSFYLKALSSDNK